MIRRQVSQKTKSHYRENNLCTIKVSEMTTLRRVLQLSKQQETDENEEGSSRVMRKKRRRRHSRFSNILDDETLADKKFARNQQFDRPKKKRGRPRKHPLPVEPAMKNIDNGKDFALKSNDNIRIVEDDGVKKYSDTTDKNSDLDTIEKTEKMTTRSASRGTITQIIPQSDKIDMEIETKLKKKPGQVVDVSWVQCDKCKKWYELPHHVDQKSLPGEWYCEMINWSYTRSYHASQCLLRRSEGMTIAQSREQEQWVECDSCKTWRKIPSFVRTNKLPSKWFCYMNVYDPLHNNCSIPQESDGLMKKKPKPTGIKQSKPKQKTYDSEQNYLLNKFIKKRCRLLVQLIQEKKSSPLLDSFVYGVEEKKLKKSKRNPTSYKDLVWWNSNNLYQSKLHDRRHKDVQMHFKSSSLFLAETLGFKSRDEILSVKSGSKSAFFKRYLAPESEIGKNISLTAKKENIFLSDIVNLGVNK